MKHCPMCRNSFPVNYRMCPHDSILLIDMKELEPGTIFNHSYRIVRLLGRGGMGVVYLAEHTLLRQPRALKFLTAELMANQDAAARLLREAQRASEIGLHQPNIVKTLDMGQSEDGSFFLCMEFVDGPSLQTLIEEHPHGMDPERAIDLIRGIASGLAAAHSKGMVHRDIKPDNILIATDEYGNEVPKITDFGIVTGKQEEARLSRTGVQPLTPGYAAPEQWKGVIPSHLLDGRTDLYSLGCVFFEMLTGEPVFSGDNTEELREQHIQTTPAAPSMVRPSLSRYAGLDKLVLGLLQKPLDARTANVKSFLSQLNDVRLATETRIEPTPEFKRTDPKPDPKPEPKPSTGPHVAPEQHKHTFEPVTPPPPPKKTIEPPPSVLATAGAKGSSWRVIAGTLGVVALTASIAGGVYYAMHSDKPQEPASYVPSSASDQHANPSSANTPTSPSSTTTDSTTDASHPAVDSNTHQTSTQPDNTAKEKKQEVNPPQETSKRDVTLPTETPESMSNRGVAMFNDKRYSESVPLLNEACDRGNLRACQYLGYEYQFALGVQQDYARTFTAYSRGCNGLAMVSCYSLGNLYENGTGVPKDLKHASDLYKQSCDGGENRGCQSYGRMVCDGVYFAKNYAIGIPYLAKACEGGEAAACSFEGYYYSVGGPGVAQDVDRGKALMKKGCDMGNEWGCDQLKKTP